jgi:hypothetical protein
MATTTPADELTMSDEGLAWLRRQLAWERSLDHLRHPEQAVSGDASVHRLDGETAPRPDLDRAA